MTGLMGIRFAPTLRTSVSSTSTYTTRGVLLRFILRWSVIKIATSAILLSAASAKTQSKPDVFLITIDTLRADHVHCYGYEHIKTPALDMLASDGVRFSEAFTPSPITNSSHTTILTGLLPSS